MATRKKAAAGKTSARKSAAKKRRLSAYQAKRDFTTTPEPSGDASPRKKPRTAKPRVGKGLFFCVQKHLASHLHYDFRLEHDGALLSWAVPKGPSLDPAEKRLAMRVEDHPLDYGEFEGVIPEGYGAGIVMLWDRGTWTPESPDVARALADGELKFSLRGKKLNGSWVLVRTRGWGGRASQSNGNESESRSWLLIKHRDQWTTADDITETEPKSAKSGRDFAEILSRNSPSIWHSHRPAAGGAAGAMLTQVIDEAARLKAKKSDAMQSKQKRRRKSAARGGKSR